MASVFKSLGKYSDDALKSFRNFGKTLKGSRLTARTVSRQADNLKRIDSSLGSSVDDGVAAMTRTTNKTTSLEAENLGRSASKVKNDADAFRGLGSAGRNTEAAAQVASKGISKTTLFLGVSGAVLISLSISSFMSTDNAVINITNIDYYDANNLKVTFDVANGSGGPNFAIRPGNTISFEGTRMATITHPSIGNSDAQVTRILGDHDFLIGVSNLPDLLGTEHGLISSSSPSGIAVSGPASPTGSTYWGQARVHSDFMSQFTGSLGDTVALVAGGAGDVLAATVSAAAPGVATALNAAATGAADTLDALVHALTPAGLNVLDTVGGAGKTLFCDIVPFACNSILWWSLGGVCIFIIIVMIVMKLKG